jgi:hypothetical protein
MSNDDRLLAAAGPGDNGLTLWTISAPGHPALDASLATMPALAGINISEDDKRLVDWTIDGHLQLWDITNPADPGLLASESFPSGSDSDLTSSINEADFAASSSELAVTLDHGLFLLDTDPTSLGRQYCAETSTITKAEWARYASNVPYQSPCSRE